MSFLLNFSELIVLALLAIDTLGFVAHNRKNPLSSNQKDFLRLCFSWVFVFALRAVFCTSCSSGVFANFYQLIGFIAKAYVCIPMFNGTEKLYTSLIEQNAAKHYVDLAVNMVKEKMGGRAETRN
jgi:hypothetical protein